MIRLPGRNAEKIRAKARGVPADGAEGRAIFRFAVPMGARVCYTNLHKKRGKGFFAEKGVEAAFSSEWILYLLRGAKNPAAEEKRRFRMKNGDFYFEKR